jgi:hypothetical protein
MALRRLLVLAFALVSAPLIVVAAPAKKAAPVAPAKDAGSAGSDAGAGSAVEPIEEPPSATEMNGTEDNPDNPHALTIPEEPKPVVAAKPVKKTYPVELAQRPITLTQNLTEISIAPHFDVSPFLFSDAIHARYGITDKIQVGVTYAYGGAWNRDLITPGSSSVGFHSGKAFGVDAAYSIFDWLAVQIGVPFYVSPFAISLQLAAPMKFHITDKFAIGGLDDLLNISLHNFAPSFYQEFDNALAANNLGTQTQNPPGVLDLSIYGIYQYQKQLAFFGRFGVLDYFGNGGSSQPGETASGTSQVFIKAGFLYSVLDNLDLGLGIGFDDLSTSGSFGVQAFVNVRI